LLASRVYEDLGAKNQALPAIELVHTLRDQVTQLERTALRIDEDKWPDVLAPMQVNTVDADPLNVKIIPATNNAITAGLFAKLFASSRNLMKALSQYRQLQRMQEFIRYAFT
jgi:Tfp pilus assembly protein PilN